MASRASIAGHPIHPMLVTFPIGVWLFSFISDIAYLATGTPAWREVALYNMAAGVVGALVAAVFGMIDLFAEADRRIKRIGLSHMTINLIVVVLFAINVWWRITQATADSVGPIWLSALAIALLVVSGWLGGHMVYIYGAAVEPVDKLRKSRQR